MSPGVTTRCAWPGRGESVTELMQFMNFLVHPCTCCSDRHASPYWTFIRRWISMGFTPSLLKKTDDRTLFFFGACCKRGHHLYTTTAPSCCVPASYCHLSATLQIMSIIVVSLQDNRALIRNFCRNFKVFIRLSLVLYWPYMFRHYCVILRDLVVSSLLNYASMSMHLYNLNFHICFMVLNLNV